jgi:hypothetical protein
LGYRVRCPGRSRAAPGRPCRACSGWRAAGQGRGGALGRSAWSRAREPIFSETRTNEFCGIGKSTPEPAGPCGPLRPGRWVYEKGAGRAAAGAGNGIDGTCWLPRLRRRSARLPAPRRVRGARLCGCELASPFLAKPIQMSFAGSGNPPQSPPARAPHCALVGGYMRRNKTSSCGEDVESAKTALAPLHGSLRRPLLVPFHTSPPSRGALRSAGVPTIAASTTPAPLLPWRIRPGSARHLGRLCRRKGIPHVRRGVGYVGAWRFARPLQSHRGYLPVGEASGLNLPVGPPLGALRR